RGGMRPVRRVGVGCQLLHLVDRLARGQPHPLRELEQPLDVGRCRVGHCKSRCAGTGSASRPIGKACSPGTMPQESAAWGFHDYTKRAFVALSPLATSTFVFELARRVVVKTAGRPSFAD